MLWVEFFGNGESDGSIFFCVDEFGGLIGEIVVYIVVD